MEENNKILCIDDDSLFIELIKDYLEDDNYIVFSSVDSTEGLELFKEHDPACVLVDLNMPGLNGIEIMKIIHESSPDTPIIMISGTGDIDDVIQAQRSGAWDFIGKPLKDFELLSFTLKKVLRQSQLIKENLIYKENLEETIRIRTRENEEINAKLRETLFEAINSLATITEKRDPYTAGHQERVSVVSVAIAEALGLDEKTVLGVKLSSMLHDIGKVYIPQEYLTKPTRLEKFEYQIIQQHSESGYDILKTIPNEWNMAMIVRQHHERLDGSGYPDGLKGNEILFEAQIICVADVLEAMSCHRPYRPSLGLESAFEELKRGSGTIYNSDIVDVCLKLFKDDHISIKPIKDYIEGGQNQSGHD